jgi:hypothetical protein
MADPAPVPPQKAFSASMRVDALLSDWRAEILPEVGSEEQERRVYESAWQAYLEGDYGFGLWCWFECDRLTNAFNGAVREVTRILGPGHYLGFSHRKALAVAVPMERVYRPRKGDMSTPRTDAIILPQYQLLCAYLVKAQGGDPKSKAQLEIALGESEDRRRADPFMKHFETFRRLLERPPAPTPPATPPPAAAPVVAEASTPPPTAPKRPRKSRT